MLVDPYDVGSIRRGLKRMLTDHVLREDLIAAGRENCQRFAPRAVARQYIELYNEVAPGILPRAHVLEPVSL